jgi:hypothetical protein
MDNKFLITGLFFVFIGVSGYWLSHIGKPIHMLLLTFHKLISLGALVYLVVTLYRIHQVTPLGPAAIAASVVSIVLFVGLIVTGGLSSIAKPMLGIVTRIHHIVPYLAVISTAAALYFTLVRKV